MHARLKKACQSYAYCETCQEFQLWSLEGPMGTDGPVRASGKSSLATWQDHDNSSGVRQGTEGNQKVQGLAATIVLEHLGSTSAHEISDQEGL